MTTTKDLNFGTSDQLLFADLYNCFAVGEKLVAHGFRQLKLATEIYDILDSLTETKEIEGQLPQQQLKAEGGHATFT